MSKYTSIIANAIEAIDIETKALVELSKRIDKDFVSIVQIILETNGRLVITGIGKSATIAQKIVATLNSTGTPSIFMHAADAVHGDLGIIQNDDIVICISKSGNTPEIKALVPLLRQGKNVLIALVGNLSSYLAKNADYILDATIEKEACPNDLAPTTSTTAQLVLGDALAVCLLKERNFSKEDFAKYHPGGALGKKLYLTVGDLATNNEKPTVQKETPIKQAIIEISKSRLGATAVLENNMVIGIVTDGDIRRMLEKHDNIATLKVNDIMGTNPTLLQESVLAADAANIMADKKISQIIVLKDKEYMGMVHIHDLNREGII